MPHRTATQVILSSDLTPSTYFDAFATAHPRLSAISFSVNCTLLRYYRCIDKQKMGVDKLTMHIIFDTLNCYF